MVVGVGASVAEAACERLPAPGLLVGDGVGAPLEVAAEVTEATPDAVVPALALPAEGVGASLAGAEPVAVAQPLGVPVPAPPLSLAGADAVAVDRGVNTAGAEAVPSRLAGGDGVCGGEPVALAPVDAEWVDAADVVGSAVPVAATDAPEEPVEDAEGVGGALAGALPVPLPVPLPLNDGELEALGEPADDAEGTREAEVEGEGVEEPTRGVAVAGGEGVTVPPPLAVAVGAPPLPVAGGEGDCVMETVPAPVAPAVPVPPPLPDAAADGEGGEEGEGSPGVRDAGSVAVGGAV